MSTATLRVQAALDARALRVRARRDVTTPLAGAYLSAFRGRGLTFEELRDYVPGDDVRWMEWSATARHDRPILKCMREERDVVLALLVDLSPSLDWGFGSDTKLTAVRRAAAAFASAAVRASDRVALASFAEGPLDRLPPARGPLQLERVLTALERAGTARATRPHEALEWIAQTLPRHAIVLLLSDLHFAPDGDLIDAFRRCGRKHDLEVLWVRDRADLRAARSTQVRVRGAEGGERGLWRGTTSAESAAHALRALGTPLHTLWTGARLLPGLLAFLEQRRRRRA